MEPFAPPYWDSYGGGVPFFNDYGPQQPPSRVPVLRPRERQPRPVDSSAGGRKHPACSTRLHADGQRTCFNVCSPPPPPRLRVFCVQSERYGGFEGLRAEECGILNGCENGRCVRVREGYTCDCFDGYELDLNKMACIGGAFRRVVSSQSLGFSEVTPSTRSRTGSRSGGLAFPYVLRGN